MRNRILAAALASAVCSPGAFAQSLPSGIDTRGYVELTYIDFDGGDETFLQSDFDIMIGPEALGFGLPIGFDFGIQGFTDGDENIKNTYAALTYRFGNAGKISLGAPRPAYDSYVRGRILERFGIAGVGGIGLFLYRSPGTFFALELDDMAPGLRYDGEFGAFSFAASYTEFSPSGAPIDIGSIGLGGAYSFGNWRIEAALDRTDISLSTTSIDSHKAGISADYGTYAFGLNYASAEVPTSFDGWELYGIYRPTDRIEIEALVLDVDIADDAIFGLAGQYKFWRDAYGEIGVISDGDDELYQVSLGWEF